MKATKWYVNVNAQRGGEHEVHKATCPSLPINREYLGTFLSCLTAVDAARQRYRVVNGCGICAPNCHKAVSV